MLKTKTVTIIYLLFFVANSEIIEAQYKFSFFDNNRNDAGIAYNFFTGPDAEDFSTTIKGFGSGFFFDLFTGRYSIDIVQLGDKVTNFSLGAGLAVNKFRFSENLVISKNGDMIEYFSDTVVNHDYGTGFFSYGKSKLVYASVFFPVYFNLTLKNVNFSLGVFLDQYITGKLKRKYKENGDKTVELVKNKEFNDFFLNKTKYGIDTAIKHNKSGVGLGFTYMLTPFFDKAHGPEIYERRITLTLDLSKIAQDKVNKNKPGINL